MTAMISTIYTLSGITSNDDVLAVRMSVSNVQDVGAVAFERLSGDETRMIIKHKDDVEIDKAALAKAVKDAGQYGLS
ncbi:MULTISPECIES: hypothetical protein [unclassified Pseudactinotalea]|uniref:hypothetical protein n=1 Tax=Micrococcales TaxID=85006 RepID=UPI003C7D9275